MSTWMDKRFKEPWIEDFLLQDISQNKPKVQSLHVLKRVCGPRDDYSEVKLVSDGKLSILGVFTKNALETFYKSYNEVDTSQQWDRCLIIVRKYATSHILHPDVYGCRFEIIIEDFSFWVSEEGFRFKEDPEYCMDVKSVKEKSEQLWSKHKHEQSELTSGNDSTVGSAALVQLLAEMTKESVPESQDEVQSQASPVKSIPVIANDNNSTDVLLPLTSDMMSAERFIINAKEYEMLNNIIEWKRDYIPPLEISSKESNDVITVPTQSTNSTNLSDENDAQSRGFNNVKTGCNMSVQVGESLLLNNTHISNIIPSSNTSERSAQVGESLLTGPAQDLPKCSQASKVTDVQPSINLPGDIIFHPIFLPESQSGEESQNLKLQDGADNDNIVVSTQIPDTGHNKIPHFPMSPVRGTPISVHMKKQIDSGKKSLLDDIATIHPSSCVSDSEEEHRITDYMLNSSHNYNSNKKSIQIMQSEVGIVDDDLNCGKNIGITSHSPTSITDVTHTSSAIKYNQKNNTIDEHFSKDNVIELNVSSNSDKSKRISQNDFSDANPLSGLAQKLSSSESPATSQSSNSGIKQSLPSVQSPEEQRLLNLSQVFKIRNDKENSQIQNDAVSPESVRLNRLVVSDIQEHRSIENNITNIKFDQQTDNTYNLPIHDVLKEHTKDNTVPNNCETPILQLEIKREPLDDILNEHNVNEHTNNKSQIEGDSQIYFVRKTRSKAYIKAGKSMDVVVKDELESNSMSDSKDSSPEKIVRKARTKSSKAIIKNDTSSDTSPEHISTAKAPLTTRRSLRHNKDILWEPSPTKQNEDDRKNTRQRSTQKQRFNFDKGKSVTENIQGMLATDKKRPKHDSSVLFSDSGTASKKRKSNTRKRLYNDNNIMLCSESIDNIGNNKKKLQALEEEQEEYSELVFITVKKEEVSEVDSIITSPTTVNINENIKQENVDLVQDENNASTIDAKQHQIESVDDEVIILRFEKKSGININSRPIVLLEPLVKKEALELANEDVEEDLIYKSESYTCTHSKTSHTVKDNIKVKWLTNHNRSEKVTQTYSLKENNSVVYHPGVTIQTFSPVKKSASQNCIEDLLTDYVSPTVLSSFEETDLKAFNSVELTINNDENPVHSNGTCDKPEFQGHEINLSELTSDMIDKSENLWSSEQLTINTNNMALNVSKIGDMDSVIVISPIPSTNIIKRINSSSNTTHSQTFTPIAANVAIPCSDDNDVAMEESPMCVDNSSGGKSDRHTDKESVNKPVIISKMITVIPSSVEFNPSSNELNTCVANTGIYGVNQITNKVMLHDSSISNNLIETDDSEYHKSSSKVNITPNSANSNVASEVNIVLSPKVLENSNHLSNSCETSNIPNNENSKTSKSPQALIDQVIPISEDCNRIKNCISITTPQNSLQCAQTHTDRHLQGALSTIDSTTEFRKNMLFDDDNSCEHLSDQEQDFDNRRNQLNNDVDLELADSNPDGAILSKIQVLLNNDEAEGNHNLLNITFSDSTLKTIENYFKNI